MKYLSSLFFCKVFIPMLLLFGIVSLQGFNYVSAQKIIYVDSSAVAGGNGLTWATAFKTLDPALDTTVYDPGDQVWVAEGTYYPDSLYAAIGINPRNKTFVLRSGLEIYGGFSTGDILLIQRDIQNNKTILSGNIGLKATDIDNAYSVVTAWYTDSSAVLDGFFIQEGRATDIGILGFVNGGGISAPDHPLTTGATVRNCTITRNEATSNGGGAYIWRNNISFYDCVFSLNTANEGGGIFVGNNSNGTLTNCTFDQNTATSFGGAAAIRDARSSYLNCSFTNNTSNQNGGALFIDANAIPYFAGATVQGNAATNNGGGFYIANIAQVGIYSSLLTGNTAVNQGGALYTQDVGTTVTLGNTTISGNNAGGRGGGVYQFSATVNVRNSIVYGNVHGFSLNPYTNQLDGLNINVSFSLIDGIATPSGSSNLNSDPLFINPVSAVLAPSTGGDYTVSKYSPAINAGNNSNIPLDTIDIDNDGDLTELLPYDLVNSFRIENTTVDMGAYETLDLCRPLGNSRLLFNDGPLSFCGGEVIPVNTRDGYINYTWQLDGQVTTVVNNTLLVDTTVKVVISLGDTTNCRASDSLSFNVLPLPEPILVGSSPILCLGDSVVLKTTQPFNTYSWSTNASTDSITVLTGGQYWVIVTDTNGCENVDSLYLDNVPKPSLTLNPGDSLSVCDGDSVLLSVSGTFIDYLWSTGAKNDSIYVKTGGVFVITGTDANGCVATDSIEVTLLSSPTVNVVTSGPTTFCTGDSVILDAGIHTSYQWSTGDTTRLVTIKQSGNPGVIVTNAFECFDFVSTPISVNAPPNATIFYANDTVFCAGDSILLSVANNYDSYLWSNGDTTFTSIIKNTGLVTVTVTDSNSCVSVDQLNTVASPLPSPLIQAAGSSTSFCQGGQVLLGLASGNFADILWEDGQTGDRTFANTGGYFNVNVEDSLGCKGADSILITVFPNPTPAITPGGTVAICQGDTVQLDAGAYTDYAWFFGNNSLPISTSQILDTDSAGNYSVRVTDANNCSGVDLVRVNVNPKPRIGSITPSGATTFCDGDSVTLDPGAFNLYRWSTSENTRTITVKKSGRYSLIVFNAFNCTDTASIEITVNPVPIASITPLGSTTICFGDSLRLDGGIHDHYRWSTGDTTQFTTVKVGGTFWLEVTNEFGCSASDTITTVLGPVLNPQIMLSGSTTLCDGDTLTLDAGVYPAYTWSTGDVSQSIKVTTGDTIWVEVSVPIGCSGSDTVIVTLANLPTPSILPIGPTSFCDGDSVVLDADAYDQYQWSTGDTTRFVTIDSAGLVTVTVTDANNCQASDSITTTVFPKPQATITPSGPTTFCDGDSVVLDGGVHDSYLWSTGDTTAQITASTTGRYELTITNAFGCEDTASIAVTVLQNPTPNIIASNTTIFCEGDSVVLDVGTFADIRWQIDGVLFDSIRAVVARKDAQYDVLVTDSSGCQGSDTIFITVNPLPVPIISVLSHNDPNFCDGDELFLDVNIFNTINWSTGESSPIIKVDSSQLVTVTVTDANGCMASDSLEVIEHPIPVPQISSSPGNAICEGDSAVLDAGSFNFYRWNNSTDDTTQFITVDTTGNYFVRVLNDFCLGYDTIFIQVNPNPVLTLTPDTLTEICENTPLTITASTHNRYLWSTLDTTQSIVVDRSGTYIVFVSETTGCNTIDSVEIIAFPEPKPVIQVSGALSFCDGDSVRLFVNGGEAGYFWSTGDTDTTIIAKTNGWYWVDVVDIEGCIGRDSIFVTVNPIPVANISPAGPTSICLGTTVTLDAGAQPAGYTYVWNTSANTRSIIVNSTSQYYVDVTSPEGCSASDTTFVIASQSIFPTITTSQPLPICEGQSVVLDAGAYQTYLWTPGLSPARTITVNTAGTYSVQVTDANGCRGDDQITVTVAPNPIPNIIAGSDTIFCEGDSVVLDGGNFPFHFWNTTDIARQISAKTSGDYSVTVVDNNNCSAADTISVLVKPAPVFSLTSLPPNPICDGDSVLLDANGTQNQYTYSWDTGDTTSQLWVKQTGTFTLTIQDTNSCTKIDSASVLVNPIPTVTIVPSGPLDFCAGDSVTLDAGLFADYLWSTGDRGQTVVIKTSGTVSVLVTDANGCQKSDSVIITVFPLPIVDIGPADTLVGCVGDTLIADGGILSDYQWSTLDTTRSISITTGGWYYLQSTDGNGCTAFDSVFAIFNALPAVSISAPDTSICPGGTMLLEATAGFTQYNWNTTDTSPQIIINRGDTYTVSVIDVNGCRGLDSITIETKPLVPVKIVALGDTILCEGDTVTVQSDLPYFEYTWSNGDTTRQTQAFATGWLQLEIRDANGCIGIDSMFILVNSKPIVTITPIGSTTFCDGDSVRLSASGGFISYRWSNGGNTRATWARLNGPISVEVEDINGCADSDTTTITVYPLPNPNINVNGPTSLCFGDQVTLSADTGFVSYRWLVNGNIISNNTSITVDSGAVYVLSVTNSNGCVGENSIQITVGSQLKPQINGDSLLCPGELSTLFVGSFNRYIWKEVGRNDTISTTSSVVVSQSGSFWIEVSDNLGCSGRDTFDVFLAPPINLLITSNNPTNICAGDSVRLSTSQAYSSYSWDTGDSTRGIWVKPAQTKAFVVTVTDQYGCTADTFRSVIVNPRPSLNVLTNIPSPYCEGDSVTLFAGTFPTVRWSRRSDGLLLSNDTILTIGTSDLYRVTVSTAQGCSERDSILINFNPNPQPEIISSRGDTLLCTNDTVSLTVNSFATYSWNVGGMDSVIQADTARRYIVNVTDLNGCQGRDTFDLLAVPLPVPTLPDTLRTCEDRSVFLDPGTFANYTWNTADSTAPLLVDTAGIYIVTVLDANRCAASDTSVVIEFPVPTVTITTSTGTTLACSSDSILLDAGGPYDRYTWLGFPDTTQFFQPTATGRYLVSVADSNGCEALGAIDVVILPSPIASFTGLDTTYCENGSRDTLTGTPAGGIFQGPGIVSSGGLTFFVPALASTGTVNIIDYIYVDPVTGCSDTARQTVTVIPVNATPIVTGVPDSVCDNDTPYILQAVNQNNGQPIAGGTFSGPGVTGPNSNGQWSFDPSILMPAQSYTVLYSFNAGFGCAANAQKAVYIKQVPQIAILSLDDTLCSNGATVQFLGNAPGLGIFSGPGVFGINDTSAFFRPSTLGAGTYTVTYVHPNQGCVSRASQDVTIVSPVQPSLGYMDSTFCSNEPDFLLTASPAGGIFRITSPGCGSISGGNIFSPSLVPNTCIGQPINIQYEVTDQNGCITNIRDTIKVYQAPTVTLLGLDTLYCIDAIADTLSGRPNGGVFTGPGASSIGNTPLFTPPLAGAGMHQLMFRFQDTLGCADSVLRTVQIDPPATIVFDPLDSAFCFNESPETLHASPAGGVFLGIGIDPSTNVFDPSVVNPGDTVAIRYRYTNPVTGCVDIGRSTIQIDTVPGASIDTLLDFFHCRERDPIVLSSTPIAPPGVFTGSTIQPPNFFDPDGNLTTFTGRDTIIFAYTNSKGCTGRDTSIINVIPKDSVYIQDFPPERVTEYCYFDSIQTFIGIPLGGTFVTDLGDTLIGGQLLPNRLPVSSTINIYYIYDDGIGCLDSTFTQVRVRPQVNPTIGNLDSIYCRNSSPIPISGLPASGFPTASDPNTIIDGSFYPTQVSRDSSEVIVYFTATLEGCTEKTSQIVRLRDTVSSSILQAGGGYCAGSEPVQLTGTPAGGWFLGNAITDSSGVFDPSLGGDGPNEVVYEVDDVIGCRSRTRATIFIKPKPQLTIFPGDNTPFTCVDRFIGFTAEARDNAGYILTDSVTFNWDYGNGQNSQGVTGSALYGEEGLYDVQLEADFQGCKNDTSLTVFVYPNPEPAFIGDTAIYLGDTAYFANQTPDADRYTWRFGDGNVTNTFDAKHRYTGLDSFRVVLEAVKEYPSLPNPEDGCSASTEGIVVVTRRPRSEYELTIFPNPSTGTLFVNVNLEGEEDVQLVLYDVAGRSVSKAVFPDRPAGFQTLTFEVGEVAEGTYILAVIAGKRMIELGGFEPGVIGPFGLRYNNRRKVVIKR